MLSIAGIYSYTPGDPYSAKALHWIKMKTIEADDELYSYTASHAGHIGESVSDILRRMLKFSAASQPAAPVTREARVVSPAIVETKPVKTIKGKVHTMHGLPSLDEYAEQERVVNHSMLLLSALYPFDAQVSVGVAESLHGRTRVYFAAGEQTLLKNGNQTKLKYTPGTPYWVITNTNIGRKCSTIEYIMQSVQFPVELIEKACGTI